MAGTRYTLYANPPFFYPRVVIRSCFATAWVHEPVDVHGREAVRHYWARQWTVVSPHFEPVAFDHSKDSVVAVEVMQSVFDLDGHSLGGQSHGLKDQTVTHVFNMEGTKIVRHDIQEAL